jgi:hypothetical protein
MNEQGTNIRQKLFGLLGKYWWVLLILVVILALTTNVPIFQYVLWGVGIIFALLIFGPFLFQLFAPAFILISMLGEHFRESKGQSAGKRYIFIPAALLAAVSFVTAQTILSIWVFIISFLIWTSVIGFFFTFLATFFFGLAPLTIISAPFVVWFKAGFVEFLGTVIFFLITAFWYGFSKMAFTEDYWKSTPENFLGYSPHTFLLGALSFQVIALPLYHFRLLNAGNIISDAGGFIFLLLALISAFKWQAIKKKLSEEEKESLYKPSVWIYIFGFFLTNLLYLEFQQRFGAPTAVIFWLNGFFLVAIILRFFGIFKRKKAKVPQIENQI